MKNNEAYTDSDWNLCVSYDSSDGEWHDASDSDWETEWRGEVESDSTTDVDDGKGRLGGEYNSDLSDMHTERALERGGEGRWSGEEEKTEQQLRED